jgi:hypothetical protein
MKLEKVYYFSSVKTHDMKCSFDFKSEEVFVKDNGDLVTSRLKLNDLKVKDFEYTPGETIYITSDCKVPRFKLKEFKEKNDINVTRDFTKADKIFISDKFVNTLCDVGWNRYSVKSSNFIEFLEKNYSKDDLLFLDIESIKNTNYVLLTYNAYNLCRNNSYNVQSFTNQLNPDTVSSHAVFLKDEKNWNIYENYNDRLYHEKELNNLVSSSQDSMDESFFTSICELLDSKDKTNHIMAMELMANCNYSNSAHYLYIIFKKYIHYFSSYPEKNHVNFKSLTQFFNLTLGSEPNMDNFINKMIENDNLSNEKLEIINQFITETLRKSLDYSLLGALTRSKYIQFSKMEYTDELIKKIKKEERLEEVENV